MRLLVASAGLGLILASAGWAREVLAPAASGWSRTDLKPVTQPASIADQFVWYASRRGELVVVALSARSGSTTWLAAATPSDNTPGVAPALAVVGDKVIYLRKLVDDIAQVVASDARSGREVWHSAPGVFTSWPVVCADDATGICVSGTLASRPTGVEVLRFDARTGGLKGHVLVSRAAGARELGPGLYDAGQRKPEYLVATGRTVAWRRPLKAIFTLPGASTDWGWNFDRVARVGLFVGSAGWPPVKRAHDRVIFDLSRAMTAGFRLRDGSVVWRNRGTTYVCSYLPCAGGVQAGFSRPGDGRSSGPSVGVRFRESGTVSAPAKSAGAGLPTASANARLIMEGFAPGTGRGRWTFNAGHNVGLLTLAHLPPQVAAHTIVLRGPNGHLEAVDLGDGSHRQVRSGASGWCRRPILYKQQVPYKSARGKIAEYVGQFAIFSCDTAGRRVSTPKRVPGFVGAIGADSEGVVAWSDTTGVFATPSTG